MRAARSSRRSPVTDVESSSPAHGSGLAPGWHSHTVLLGASATGTAPAEVPVDLVEVVVPLAAVEPLALPQATAPSATVSVTATHAARLIVMLSPMPRT